MVTLATKNKLVEEDSKSQDGEGVLVVYNLKSENNSQISEDEQKRLRNLRHRIVDTLRHQFHALNVGKGQWFVKGNTEELKECISNWNEKYEEHNDSFVDTTDVGLGADFFITQGMEKLKDKSGNLKKKMIKMENNLEDVNYNKVKKVEREFDRLKETLEKFEDDFEDSNITGIKEELEVLEMKMFELLGKVDKQDADDE